MVLQNNGAALLSENVEIIVGDGAHAHPRHRAGMGRRRHPPRQPLRHGSAGMPASPHRGLARRQGHQAQPVDPPGLVRARTPNCSDCTSRTPASTSNSGSTSSTSPNTRRAASTTRARSTARARTPCGSAMFSSARMPRHRHLRAEPQPGTQRGNPRGLRAEPRDRNRGHPRRRARQCDRPIRRRAAVLPAGARHHANARRDDSSCSAS